MPKLSCPVAVLLVLVSCADGSTPNSPAAGATKLFLTVAPSASAQNRAVFATQPVVQLQAANGRAVSQGGVPVTVTISVGAGTLDGPATVETAANGTATFANLSIRGSTGSRTLTFSAPGLSSATATVVTTAGVPTGLEVSAGDGQLEAELLAVPVAPAVKVVDADGNGVPGVLVTFAVTGGGGAVTGATAETNPQGIARVGQWTLGLAGVNTLSASAAGVGTSVGFTATAVHLAVASVAVRSPSMAALLPNATRQYTATALDSVGRALANRAFTWSTGSNTVATVSSSGLVTAVLPGTTSIAAVSEGKTGTANVVVVAPTLTPQAPLTGHFGITLNGNGAPPAGFEYGFGYYSSVHVLNAPQTLGTQLGWGSWMVPNNLTFTQPLCPVGTVARDNWPERGPSYRDVYQTIEGGAGQWVSTRFPAAITKFRVNAVPDCYNTQIASGAWHFYGTLLAEDKLGLAQLSNRLLVPPDGLTFTGGAALFGHAWVALPLIPAYTASNGLAVGDQSWTLFAHAANFKGPVVFFTPEVWTRVHLTDPTGRGRSHDVRPMMAGGVAIEIGSANYFTGTDATGTRYRRVPRLTFPVDASGKAIVAQDMRFFSKEAIWNGIATWMDHGVVATQFNPAGAIAPTVSASFNQLNLSGESVLFSGGFTAGAITNSAGQPAFGMEWSGTLEPGVLPEYFKDNGSSQWIPVPGSEVPRVTWLADQTFAPHPRGSFPEVATTPSSPFASGNWSAGPFSAVLSDGSTVDYVWYRFVDQPAIARLGLSTVMRDKLQGFVESLHETWGLAGVTIPPPSAGTTATLDAALLVTPPGALSKGYVPIVIRQR
jgi:hypothetical protein